MRAPARHAGRLLSSDERRILRLLGQDLAQRIDRAGGHDAILEAQLASVKREQQTDRDTRPAKRGKGRTRT